ncbi:hypothetical protein QWY86_02380 [Pedobacter aquatilis]|uniref:hypothetical protein n=1 Tax=Pedobacter aquatilis TaxID=351343 RepID=UPI0025B32E11|nr:hypothetical protein [Pedobacter aquatilis]MDN3585498.1 hypothetical protein [Pedobacter aquatilis]
METLTIEIPEEKNSMIRQVLKEFGVNIIDPQIQNKKIELSPEQKSEINSSQEQIKNGLIVENSTLKDEVDKWLKK